MELPGSCGRGGTAIDWVMQPKASASAMRSRCCATILPLTEPSTRPLPQKSTVPKLPAPIERTADDKQLLLQVVSYYHETLKQRPEAQQYLVKRGLQSAEMVEHFRLGFANRTLGYRLPASNRLAGAEQRGRLQKLGIYRESGHEHFNGSLVIPIFDLERRSGADVRAQDHAESARGNTRSSVPAGTAARRVERSRR